MLFSRSLISSLSALKAAAKIQRFITPSIVRSKSPSSDPLPATVHEGRNLREATLKSTITQSTMRRSAAAAGLLSSVALGPLMLATTAAAAVQPNGLNCTALAQIVKNGAGNKLNQGVGVGNNVNVVNPNTNTFQISNNNPVTAKIINGTNTAAAYCQVVFQLNSGPNENDAMTIEVGLPLNTLDGGTGTGTAGCNNIPAPAGNNPVTANNSCYTGNWNGRIESLGNGGFAGSVTGVTSATNAGFVGTGSDDGHSTNWCNAINPQTGLTNAQPNCGTGAAGFALDPNNKLLTTTITDLMDTSETNQTKWGQTLAEYYYGSNYPIKRTYWNGCSTGGRQAFEQAIHHPELYDGLLGGAPGINYDRLFLAGIYLQLAIADIDPVDCPGGPLGAAGTAEGCNNGVSTVFQSAFTYANAQAVAACDTLGSQGLGNDIVADGVINEPRYCTFDATTLIGTSGSPMTSPMTTAQAQATNMIWNGAHNQAGELLFGGLTKGTINLSCCLFPSSTSNEIPNAIKYWFQQNPNFDVFGTITTSNIGTYYQAGAIKFNDTNPNLPGFAVAMGVDQMLGNLASTQHAGGITGTIHNGQTGTKLLHYRGLSDPYVVPFSSWNYTTRLFELYGAPATQAFYASLYFPGNGHCGGNTSAGLGGGNFPNAGLLNTVDLFNALINWVENGTYPSSMVAYTLATDKGNSTLICNYPNQPLYNGTGPTTSASSYSCVPPPNAGPSGEDPILAAYDQTAPLYHEAP